MAALAGPQWRPRKWFRWRGDRARNRKNWDGARRFYERHLQEAADDQAIWVQLAHARKEVGDRTGAISAYRQALLLNPDDADATRHLEGVIRRRVSFHRKPPPSPGSADAPADLPVGEAAADAGPAPDLRHHTALSCRHRLVDAPDDAGAWIEYAQALAAFGDTEGAHAAFRQAASSAKDPWEGCFHFAMALREAGRHQASDLYLAKALRLRPCFGSYYEASAELRARAEAPADPPGRRLYLDISDLLDFVATRGFATGIQRVQLGLMEALLSGARPQSAFDDVAFAFSALGQAWRPAADDLRALVEYLALQLVDLDVAGRIVEQAKQRASLCAPGAGATWLVLGGFWGDPDARVQRQAARARGAKIGVFVHDIFAITRPELCEEGASERFEPAFRDGLASWDFVATNSHFTARDVGAYMARGHAPALPIAPAPLTHGHQGAAVHGRGVWPAALADLEGQPFVLCVGTIEPRKNHAALIDAWTELCRAHADMPTLVLAGRPGWRMAPILERLAASGLEGTKIRWVDEIADVELDALYRACRFTVFPSLAEGWGIPVGESLARGKACITSSGSALVEVGGDFASYFDPATPDGLRAAIETLAYQPGELARREEAIRQSFRPRTWSDTARDLMTSVAAITELPRE